MTKMQTPHDGLTSHQQKINGIQFWACQPMFWTPLIDIIKFLISINPFATTVYYGIHTSHVNTFSLIRRSNTLIDGDVTPKDFSFATKKISILRKGPLCMYDVGLRGVVVERVTFLNALVAHIKSSTLSDYKVSNDFFFLCKKEK